MAKYERMSEDLLREADKLMCSEYQNPRNNFRKALDKLELLHAQKVEVEIFHVLHGPDKGGIYMVNKRAAKLEKAF